MAGGAGYSSAMVRRQRKNIFGGGEVPRSGRQRPWVRSTLYSRGQVLPGATTQKDYGSLNAVQKDILMRLEQGEYIVENPVLRAPIRIRFPMPVFRQYK